MRILAIGDVVGKNGLRFLNSKLKTFKKEQFIDFVIVNGENSFEFGGITPDSAKQLFLSGADIITTGNHTFKRKEIRDFLDMSPNILRPANYPKKTTPGKGYLKTEINGIKTCVLNIMGNVYMNGLNCPFETADEILEAAADCKVKILDFHAEATAEKLAMGFYLDGRISALFGTHTHVQTSDETVLPRGTGYITDIGMTGPVNSILGVKKELSIRFMKEKLPVKFENASGNCKIECIIFEIDENTGLTKSVKRYRITEG